MLGGAYVTGAEEAPCAPVFVGEGGAGDDDNDYPHYDDLQDNLTILIIIVQSSSWRYELATQLMTMIMIILIIVIIIIIWKIHFSLFLANAVNKTEKRQKQN